MVLRRGGAPPRVDETRTTALLSEATGSLQKKSARLVVTEVRGCKRVGRKTGIRVVSGRTDVQKDWATGTSCEGNGDPRPTDGGALAARCLPCVRTPRLQRLGVWRWSIWHLHRRPGHQALQRGLRKLAALGRTADTASLTSI